MNRLHWSGEVPPRAGSPQKQNRVADDPPTPPAHRVEPHHATGGATLNIGTRLPRAAFYAVTSIAVKSPFVASPHDTTRNVLSNGWRLRGGRDRTRRLHQHARDQARRHRARLHHRAREQGLRYHLDRKSVV